MLLLPVRAQQPRFAAPSPGASARPRQQAGHVEMSSVLGSWG